VRKKKATLFDQVGQSEGSVVLNWHGKPEGEFIHFAEAFHLTTQEAIATLRQNKYFGPDGIPIEDFRAYPVVFLYRHAIELYLKAALCIGEPMLSLKGQPPVAKNRLNTHDLVVLREEWERVREAYAWAWNPSNPYFPTIERFRDVIQELHEVDEGSYAFRYPLDKKGLPSLRADLTFDVLALADVLDGMLHILRNAALGAHYELEDAYQEMDDRQQYERESESEPDYESDRSDD
jgi:hypothetical protein